MVAAEDDRDRAGAGHVADLAVDHRVPALDPGGHDVRVARVDDGQDLERVDVELQGVEAARGVVGLADRPRPEPGAGPMADRVVERRADDGDVDTQSAELGGIVDPGQLRERHRPDIGGQVVVRVRLVSRSQPLRDAYPDAGSGSWGRLATWSSRRAGAAGIAADGSVSLGAPPVRSRRPAGRAAVILPHARRVAESGLAEGAPRRGQELRVREQLVRGLGDEGGGQEGHLVGAWA